jgi:hypothetical protein
MNSHPAKPATKTALKDGRAALLGAGVRRDKASGGVAGEFWLNKHGSPVFISYFAGDISHVSRESLERALAQKDERLI